MRHISLILSDTTNNQNFAHLFCIPNSQFPPLPHGEVDSADLGFARMFCKRSNFCKFSEFQQKNFQATKNINMSFVRHSMAKSNGRRYHFQHD